MMSICICVCICLAEKEGSKYEMGYIVEDEKEEGCLSKLKPIYSHSTIASGLRVSLNSTKSPYRRLLMSSRFCLLVSASDAQREKEKNGNRVAIGRGATENEVHARRGTTTEIEGNPVFDCECDCWVSARL